MAVTLIRPSADLQGVVRHFRIREDRFSGDPVRWPLTARADQFIEFYLADPYQVVDFLGGSIRAVAPSVVVGPHTRRKEDLIFQGTLKVFTIHFQPAGFHRLFGIPLRGLADNAFSAADVLGGEIVRLHERLHQASDDCTRVAIAEAFLRMRIRGDSRPDPVQQAAAAIVASHGQADIASVARTACLSVRQLERRFLEQVGVTPKVLSRLVRFHRALRLRQELPGAGWARIAVQAGYYDQMHLVKEFRAFAGDTPSRVGAELGSGDLDPEAQRG